MHMPPGLCYGACNVVFFNVQQGVQQGTLSRTLSRDKVRDKVPYRARYRAIRCAIRYLVAHPYRAIRCAIRYLVALGTLHHLIAFHLILLCPVAPVAFFIRCCTHAPIFTHLLLFSQVTVVQWPRLDLVQAPEAPDVAGSKVGHVAPAAESFTGVGEEWQAAAAGSVPGSARPVTLTATSVHNIVGALTQDFASGVLASLKDAVTSQATSVVAAALREERRSEVAARLKRQEEKTKKMEDKLE